MSATSDTSRASADSRFSVLPSQTEDRITLAAVALATAVVIVIAIYYLGLGLGWRNTPFIGVMTTQTLTVDGSQPVDASGWSGLNAGLQRGDHLLGINGTTFPVDYNAALQAYDLALAALHFGDHVTVAFERPTTGSTAINNAEACGRPISGVAHCEVSYIVNTFPDNDFLAFFIVPFISGLITIGIGIVVLVLRPFNPASQTVTGVCLTMSIFMFGIFDINSTHQLIPLWIAGTTFTGVTLAVLGLVFPIKLPIVYRRPGINYIPAAIGTLVTALILFRYYNPPSVQGAVSTVWLPVLSGIGGMIFLVIMLLRRREIAASVAVRDQSNTVLIGVLLALVIGVIWVFNLALRVFLGYDPIPLNTSAAAPFLILPPLSMAYAVLQYRTFDTDRVISQAITYTVMLFGLLVGYFLLVFSAVLIARQAIGPGNPILLALVIFFMALLFVPVRTRLQARIDRIYFRKRLNYQEKVEDFGRRLSSLIDFNDIINAYRAELTSTLLPTQIFIFLPDRQTNDYVASGTDMRFTQDSPLLAELRQGDGLLYLEPGQPWPEAAVAERSRLMLLKTTVIAGMRGANRLIAFICIAPPRSMSGRYTFEELRFIQTLTTQISVAVERAQVVESLEHRVRELDVLSQVSQAVNFTVDVDDLLELIYAQTVRLIEATHFYITLRDPETNELYHAFFLEEGERYGEKENRRWAVGSDLFSEVVRTGQPIGVTNYPQALTERGASIIYEDRNLRSWIGVPMLAGSRTIGVLSAGTTKIGQGYREDQRRILNDLGSLAATSLDKVRLFAETNRRARQLAALNDITQQIVAAELDVEKLLQLITASATDILDAQAGSLLLTVDDGSGDLEFRVAVGGSGQNLIGSRLPAGRGLVGEVAATGQMVIVNDVSNDPRWGGELSKGAFHTTTVLAGPLITQNNVIGVLEVLNKKNSATFTSDDADLLTAFAGQAAVAIENARLFQMTDLQLSERLSELETLERIDVELNRSLDLSKVSQITLHWAMENSSAVAGLIGLVIGDPPKLEVIYKLGYADDEVPLGTEGNLWPLDRGITSRVLRTRQPELVPDVKIDPNYQPSLRGALSQITLPMLSGGAVNAILILETNRDPRLRLADMPFLQRLAEHASIAIANAQLYAELTRANQSKSEFVSFVAHELKNPLTSIKGYSDVLLNGAVGAMSEPQKNFLNTIRFNAERMNTLVSDLNDVTKLQTDNMRMEFTAVNFRSVLTETLRPLQKQIDDKGQTLELNLPDDLPLIQADQNRLI